MKTKYIIIVVAVVVVGLGVYWSINYLPNKLTEWSDSLAESSEPLDESEVEELIAYVPDETEDDIIEEFPKDMTENEVMDSIHHMTHQKIKAEDGKKWGALQITPERIERLINLVKTNEYKHEEFYLETLEEWQAGRFNNSVQVHNYIWNLKGGTIGEAERLLTAEEEARYIKQNFK